MELKQLGRSGLFVSELSLGAMTFGMPGWGCDEKTSVAIIDRYLDAGGNVIETADCYSASEEIIGRAVQSRRDQVVIATKFGLPIGPSPHDRGAGRIRVLRACETSLRRLGTDHIDLYQVHVDDPAVPLEETVAALDDLLRAGKIRYAGLSNFRAFRVMQALSIAERLGASRFVSFQGQYNLIARGLEREHFPLFAQEKLGVLSWSPLGSGMLTGKVTRDASGSETRLQQEESPLAAKASALVKNERGFEIADLVKEMAATLGCQPAQLALAWQRTRPITSVIIGVRTTQQLEDNLGSLDVEIPDDMAAFLDEATRPAAEYPTAFIDLFQGAIRGAGATVMGRSAG